MPPPLCTNCVSHLISHLDLEPESCHAALILLDRALAVLLRIVALRKQHALVATGLLVLAHAARLDFGVFGRLEGGGDSGRCVCRRGRWTEPSHFGLVLCGGFGWVEEDYYGGRDK